LCSDRLRHSIAQVRETVLKQLENPSGERHRESYSSDGSCILPSEGSDRVEVEKLRKAWAQVRSVQQNINEIVKDAYHKVFLLVSY
jgi:hypothetical protein